MQKVVVANAKSGGRECKKWWSKYIENLINRKHEYVFYLFLLFKKILFVTKVKTLIEYIFKEMIIN